MTPFLAIMVHNLWTIFRKWIVLDHTILKTLDMMGYINGGSHYFGPYWTILDHILDYFGPYWTIFAHMRSCWSILAHSIGQNIFKTLPIKNISQQDRFTTSNRYITIPHRRTTLADFIFPPPQLRKITYLFVSTSFQVFLFRCSEFYFSPWNSIIIFSSVFIKFYFSKVLPLT